MDHDMFSCNIKSSFLDDLSDFSQESTPCKYPQTNRISNTNSYSQEMYTTQASMNYYNESQQNYQRQNVYSYNYPNYDFNTAAPEQQMTLSYLQMNPSDNRMMMDNDRLNMQSNNLIGVKSGHAANFYDQNYQNYVKYCSLPKTGYSSNPLYRGQDPSSSGHNDSLYQYPSQYFQNGNQAIYYDQNVSQMERVAMQNLASLDQNIYACEAKLHLLSQTPSNSSNYVHEMAELKERLIYCQQLREKYLLSRNRASYSMAKVDASDRKEIISVKQGLNSYAFTNRTDMYPCQRPPFPQYVADTNFSKQSDSYNFYQYPSSSSNSKDLSHVFQEPMFQKESVAQKSFISELIETDNPYHYEPKTLIDSNRDELSTPPISEFTDLTTTISIKSSPNLYCHNIENQQFNTTGSYSNNLQSYELSKPLLTQESVSSSIDNDSKCRSDNLQYTTADVGIENNINIDTKEVLPPELQSIDDNTVFEPRAFIENECDGIFGVCLSSLVSMGNPSCADNIDCLDNISCQDNTEDMDNIACIDTTACMDNTACMDDAACMDSTTCMDYTECVDNTVFMDNTACGDITTSDDIQPKPQLDHDALDVIESEIPTELYESKPQSRFKIQFKSHNSSKWSFKRKIFYFRLKIKKINNSLSLRPKINNVEVIFIDKDNEKSIKNNERAKEQSIIIRTKKISSRIKDAESFLKRKVTKGSYFNNSDNEDMNLPKRSLRNSTKSEMKTRTKKGINFEEESIDESSSSSECDVDSTFELPLDNNDNRRTIHKILGSRIIKICDGSSVSESEKSVEEYYLKYRGLSYIHCEWKVAETIEDPTFSSKLKRYKNANSNAIDESDECLFNPDYVEIERVLDLKEIEVDGKGTDNKEIVTYYLVKWRSLSYEEISWERSEDVDPSKVKDFFHRNENSYLENSEIPKPTHIDWTPISSDIIYKNGNILRDYQLEGVNWLTFCWITNRNCILADEMGLGKTIQSIAFLIELYNYQFKGPFLVIVPLSTLGNWQREFEQWSDLNVIVYHGSARGRNIEQKYETFSKTTDICEPKNLLFNVLVTTYEVLISDLLFLSKFQWTAAIIDEAHRLKNKRCKLFEGLKILDLQFRVLLTGTPLQNNVQELHNLLNFLEPSMFCSESAFLRQYGDLRSEEQVASLKSLLKPMMLRRLKEDVEKGLAPKEEIVVEVELTNIQKKYYRAILERNFGFLSKGTSGSNGPNLMNTMMELRKCCNHPFLIKGAEDSILNNIKNGSDMGNITKFIQNKIVDEETLQFYSMVYASGKLVLIHKLLSKLKQDGHKVLIFSQMVRVLDILEDYLIYERYQYERIDGRIYGLLRQEAIDRFSNDPEKFVFLLCTKAGGLGINLTAADVVIIYDSDWNPQNDLQAQARCHRIGQQKLVNVYRLITRNTYEREMFDRASLKLGLDKAILQSMSYVESKPTSQLTKKEIEDLLKLGAYGALLDDDKDGEKFCEEDIEKILLSRSTVVKLNNLERNSSFSKASFSISDNRLDICLDDPNFWQKWAKKAGVDEKEICNTLIMDKPRLRRQTNRYKPNCTLYDDVSGDDSNSSFIDTTKSRFSNVKNIANSVVKLNKKSNKSCSGDSVDESKEDFCSEEIQYKATPDMDRYDLFKAEKCLLQFGWGRWEHALEKITFKTPISVKELESLCRTILLYAHRYYSGDARIHSFIEDLLLQNSDSTIMRKHVGYSAPVARGRRGRKGPEDIISLSKKERNSSDNKSLNKKAIAVAEDLNNLDEEQSDVLTNISTPLSENGDTSENDSEFSVLICPNFCKHIQRTSHKLLHRIQFLYFLHHDIIGPDRAKLILNNTPGLEIPGFSELKLFTYLDNDYLPFWWNRIVDKSLLLGIFKHGWEKYDEIFKDPTLGFVDWLKGDSYPESDGLSKNNKLKSSKNKLKEKEEITNSKQSEKVVDRDKKDEFPTNTELNIRLRKIIGSFQKLWRQRENETKKLRALSQSCETPFQITDSSNGDAKTRKWSRREETEFYRAVNSYGIEKLPDSDEFIWSNFRNVCNLPRKSNDSLTEYFKAFYTMCQKVCQKYPLLYGDTHSIEVDNISSERACRCLVKTNLISKIRNEILHHSQLEEHICFCQSTNDFPSWWIPGYHDLSLLKGISRYGANRTEISIIMDSSLNFYQTITDLIAKDGPENNIKQSEGASAQRDKFDDMPIKEESTVIAYDDNKLISNEEGDESLTPLVEQIENALLESTCDEIIEEIFKCENQKTPLISKDEPMNSSENFLSNNTFDITLLSKIGWPKERVLMSRLDLIVQTIEKGVWPFAKTQNSAISKTISETLDQFSEPSRSCSEKTNLSSKVIDKIKAEPQDTVFKTKRRGRKRAAVHLMLSKQLDGRDHFSVSNEGAVAEESDIRAAYDSWSSAIMSAALSSSMSNDSALFMQKMLQMSPELSNNLSKCSTKVNNSSNGVDLSNGMIKMGSSVDSSFLDSGMWSMQQSSSVKSMKQNVRRGRRPKQNRSFEMTKEMKPDCVPAGSMVSNYSVNPLMCGDLSNNNPEIIIPVINIFDGTIIYDESAPKRKNLENYLIKNSNFMPYSVEEEDQKIFRNVAKARGQDTSTLDSLIFTQYMSFLMNTMMASQAPFANIYNNASATTDIPKTPLSSSEDQLNAASLYMQYFSMMAAANLPQSAESKPSILSTDESIMGQKRPHSPVDVSRQGTPAKVKSYSISHLTESTVAATDENTIPAHSKTEHITTCRLERESCLSSSFSHASIAPPNLKFHADLSSSVLCNTKAAVVSEGPSKAQLAPDSPDLLGAYQAYLYSAMMYSDYVSYMQQYASLEGGKTGLEPSSADMLASVTSRLASSGPPSSFKVDPVVPPRTASATVAPHMPHAPHSWARKKSKVTSFSVESMGIAASCTQPRHPSSLVTSSGADDDDCAVLDLSNNK